MSDRNSDHDVKDPISNGPTSNGPISNGPTSNGPEFDEDKLASALSGLSAPPDEFRAGLDAKMADKNSAQTANANTPKWLRRAASIAPAGLTDLAIVGPGSSAKSAPLLTFLVTPWALLALSVFAFVGMLAATLRLSASRSEEDAPIGSTRAGIGAWMAIAILPAWISVQAMFDRDSTWILGAFLIGGLIVVMAARSLSRAGLADRERIGSHAMAGLCVVMILTMLAVMGHRDATSWLTLTMLPIVAGTAVLIGKLSKQGQVARILLIYAAFNVWLTLDRVNVDPMSRDDLVKWCQQFDDDTVHKGSWGALGYSRRALGEPFPGLARAAEQLLTFAPTDNSTKWHIGNNAWRAGLATPELLSQLQFSDESWSVLSNDGQHLYENGAVGLAAAEALGKLDEAKRAAAWKAIDRTMQHAMDTPSIRTALTAVEAATALGDDAFAERHRDAIHAILTSSVTHSGRERGGFGEWHGSNHDNLFTMFDYTRRGVTLMSYVGAPSSLDLYELDRYLTRYVSRKSMQRGLTAMMTRAHLRSFCDVKPNDPAALVFIRENLTVLIVILFCGLSLWVVVRAPKAIPIEVGPLATHT